MPKLILRTVAVGLVVSLSFVSTAMAARTSCPHAIESVGTNLQCADSVTCAATLRALLESGSPIQSATPCVVSVTTGENARIQSRHDVRRRLGSGRKGKYKCKLDASEPFNSTEPFVVDCEEVVDEKEDATGHAILISVIVFNGLLLCVLCCWCARSGGESAAQPKRERANEPRRATRVNTMATVDAASDQEDYYVKPTKA